VNFRSRATARPFVPDISVKFRHLTTKDVYELHEARATFTPRKVFLWLRRVADADIIFLPCGFFLYLPFFHRLISAVADWMSAILPHMM